MQSVDIIPVIDLMGGIAVHAVRGRRETYRPLQTPICAGCDPRDVIDGFQRLHPFRTVYVADLDALMGRPDQGRLIADLQSAYPSLGFWVDAGLPLGEPPWTPVVGSESLSLRSWEEIGLWRRDWILSLDFIDGRFKGPQPVWEQVALWPDRVIVMTLDQVGSLGGPDLDRLAEIRRRAPDRHLIAAGGVRDGRDLAALQRASIRHVLVASALHNGGLCSMGGRLVGAEKGKSA